MIDDDRRVHSVHSVHSAESVHRPRRRTAMALRAVATFALATFALAALALAVSGRGPTAVAAPGSSAPTGLRFIPNRGQWPAAVRYRADTARGALFVTDDGLTFVDENSAIRGDGNGDGDRNGAGDSEPGVVRMRFPALPAPRRYEPGARLAGVSHYLRGPDPARWVVDVPAYDGLVVRGVRPGVDLRIAGGRDGALDVRLRSVSDGPIDAGLEAFASASTSAASIAGLDAFASASTSAASIADRSARDNERIASNTAASTTDAMTTAASSTAAMTPTLAYSTYLGGRLHELARGIAVDGDGNAYVVGTTTSIDYPALGVGGGDPLQPVIGNGGSLQDAFVTKLDPTGTQIIWSTYLGGARQDEAFDVAVDAAGRAHVTGYTTSPDFPTAHAVQPELHLAEGVWSGDAFMVRLAPGGDTLEVGTFLGGTGRDVGKGIALGADGSIYLTGWTGSNFPAVNAVHKLNRGVRDAFISKFTPAGDQLAYSTHLGGSDADEARDIAVDAAGNAYIVGTTQSRNVYLTAPFQRTFAGDSDAFVARLNADGAAFGYATYLGGRGSDQAIGIAVDALGQATVLGRTSSPDFPRQAAQQPTRSGPADLFVTRLSADGSALVYSTYMGGAADEGGCVQDENYRDLATATPDGRAIRYLEGSKFTDGPAGALALDADGRAIVASCTSSGNVPVVRAIQDRRNGDYALLLAVLTPDGAGLDWASYLGGRGMNVARAAAFGPDGGIYVAGQTDATDFPLAPAGRALDDARGGTDDAFALKIEGVLEAPPATAVPTATATAVPPTVEATSTRASTGTATVEATREPTATRAATASATATVVGMRWVVYLPVGTVP